MRMRLLAALAVSAGLLATAAPAGAFVFVPFALQSASNGIALGPDGNFWVAEQFSGSVARVTPAGAVINRFALGATAAPTTVTTGPGGRVWVAATGAHKLVWFDATSATPVGHDVPTPSTCGPVGLVAGGDGRMYMSLPSDGAGCAPANLIGSVPDNGAGVATANTVVGTVFDLVVTSGKLFAPDFDGGVVRRLVLGTLAPEAVITASPGSGPDGIAADGAGNIWFTEFNTGRIGRVAATAANGSAATEVTPTGGTLTNPFGIVAGPDGGMYVAGKGSQNIARVAPDGTFTFFAAPNAQPLRIVNGIDGDLWITDQSNARVLRFVNTAPRASTDGAAPTSTSTASLAATVNPRGNDTTVVFDYGTTTAYGASSAPVGLAGGADPVAVAAAIAGLAPATTYHVRVRATNAVSATLGADLAFTTPAAAPAPPLSLPTVPGPFITKLAATTTFGFSRHATYTIVSRIDLKKLAGGETATIRCSGAKKCAFKTKTYLALKTGTRTFGKALLKGRKLPVGTTITVTVTRAGAIGTSTTLKVRKRRAPQITRRCLAPGATKPTACP